MRPLARSRLWPLALGTFLGSRALHAQTATDSSGDRFSLRVESETQLQLYRRALLPGPAGAIVETETAAPMYEYVSLRVDDLDSPWGEDDVDVELSAWGNSHFSDLSAERRLDGDVQSANVRFRRPNYWFRLGRQSWAGGAARYVRFDGAAVGGRTDVGFGAGAYAGLTVLPRWQGQRGYHQLGSAADSLLETPDTLQQPSRSDNWLAGARLFYSRKNIDAGLSVHEQYTDGGLGRRSLGADARTRPLKLLFLGGNGNLDLDSTEVIDARLWADVTVGDVGVSAEVLHAKPALYLSRQSVLSVFGGTDYDEVGGSARYTPFQELRLWVGGYLERYSGGEDGSRGEVGLRATPDRWEWTVVRLSAARVIAPENGYYSLRSSVRQRLTRDFAGTAEAYLYMYDDPIAQVRTSSVYATALEWQALPELQLLWGTSLARTPYASGDLQTMLRVVYSLALEDAR